MSTEPSVADITLIGGGLSALHILIGLAQELEKSTIGCDVIHISVIDKAGSFGRGLPYGAAAGDGLLLLPARYMLPGLDQNSFLAFLSERTDLWLKAAQQSTSPGVRNWLEQNSKRIAHAAFADMYFPRFVFGLFLTEQLHAVLKRLEEQGNISVSLVHDEVLELAPCASGLQLKGKKSVYHSRYGVLCVGSPLKKLTHGGRTIDSFYAHTFSEHRQNLLHKLLSAKDGTRNILIIGSSAAALDVVYLFGTDTGLARLLGRVDVVSPSGLLPETATSKAPAYHPLAVSALCARHEFSADDLWSAVRNDWAAAREAGYSSSDLVQPLRQAVKAALALLPPAEESSFVSHYATQLLALTRTTGPEYRGVLDELMASGKLRVIRAQVDGVREARGFYHLLLAGDAGAGSDLGPYLEVYNCTGPEPLGQSTDALLHSLQKQGYAERTAPGAGLKAGEGFKVTDRLYVMGPLLAGNQIDGTTLWHLESSWKISELAPQLGRLLLQKVLKLSV